MMPPPSMVPGGLKAAVLGGIAALALRADVQWRAPSTLGVGEMAVIELRETDPAKPPLMRPPLDDRVGSLRVRGVEPSSDGRGWRIQVLPLGPGSTLLPPMDLGDGRRSPELRLTVPRTVPFGAPWMGLGGGPEDELPPVPFPWMWALLALVPIAVVAAWAARRWSQGSRDRLRKQAWKAFLRHWPPPSKDRRALDEAHGAGRNLLAASLGEAARSWGPSEFRAHHLEPWDLWVLSLDAARFSRSDPPFPSTEALRGPLRARKGAP